MYVPLPTRRIALVLALNAFHELPAQSTADTTHTIVNGPLGARADSALTRLQAAGFSGVAFVAKDGRVVLKKGYGLANREAQTAMTGNSVIQIGSNTKDFTVVSILQLQERGRLSLDDSIPKYFASVPPDKRAITIRQLLLHRAGFNQHMGPDWDVVSRDEEVRRALSSPLLFVPGADRAYSNIGYSLLAAVIEKVSSMPYDEYVRDNILKPVRLHDTGLLLPQFDPTRVAHGYRDGHDAGTFLQRPHAPDGPYWNLRGNGGMLSTVSDMYRFYRALMSDGPLLKPATRDLFFHPDQPEVLAGSDMTFFFFYSRYPGAHVDAILVSNSTDYAAEKARRELDAALGIAPLRGGPRDGAPLAPAITLPDTPPGRAVQKYLRAYLDADPGVMRRFLQDDVIQSPNDHRTIQERMAGFEAMRDDLGALTPVEIQSANAGEMVVRMRAAHGGQATFTFTVQEAAPYRITGIRIEVQ